MYKGQGGRAINSNFQYISDNRNLTFIKLLELFFNDYDNKTMHAK